MAKAPHVGARPRQGAIAVIFPLGPEKRRGESGPTRYLLRGIKILFFCVQHSGQRAQARIELLDRGRG